MGDRLAKSCVSWGMEVHIKLCLDVSNKYASACSLITQEWTPRRRSILGRRSPEHHPRINDSGHHPKIDLRRGFHSWAITPQILRFLGDVRPNITQESTSDAASILGRSEGMNNDFGTCSGLHVLGDHKVGTMKFDFRRV